MTTDNIFPDSWNLQNTDNLFPEEAGFPDFPSPDDTAFNEEWQPRTMKEIQAYFFPEAKVTEENGIRINDTTGVFKNTRISSENRLEEPEPVLLDEVVIDHLPGIQRAYLDLDKIEICIFTSKDGAQLLRAWKNAQESVHKNPYTLALFMETDDDFNIFGSVMDFVVGREVERHFKADYWIKVLDFVKNNEVSVSSKDVGILVGRAISKPSFFRFIGELYNTVKNRTKRAALDAIALNFGLISAFIETQKIRRSSWDSSHPDFEYENMPFFPSFKKDFDRVKQSFKEKMPYDAINKIRSDATAIVLNIYDRIKQETDKVADSLPKHLRQKLKQLLEIMSRKLKGIYNVIKDNTERLVELYKSGTVLLNAFLCGFINGLTDLIKSVFDLIVLLVNIVKAKDDYENYKGYYTDLVYEYLENAIEALSKFDIIAFARKMMILQLVFTVRIAAFIRSLSLSNINFNTVAYFTGYIVFGIIQLVIEILLTGGSATVARLFRTGADVMAKTVKGVMRFGDNLLDVLRGFIRMFEKGVDEVVAFFKKIIDDFFDWLEDMFKKGKQKYTRKATKLDIETIAKIRNKYKPRPSRNVAFSRGEIGGVKIELECVSGGGAKTPWKQKGNFETPNPESYFFKNGPEALKVEHTEQKILEYLYQRFKNNRNVTGKIELVSDLRYCDNCYWITDEFQKIFPNIEIVRVFIKEKL